MCSQGGRPRRGEGGRRSPRGCQSAAPRQHAPRLGRTPTHLRTKFPGPSRVYPPWHPGSSAWPRPKSRVWTDGQLLSTETTGSTGWNPHHCWYDRFSNVHTGNMPPNGRSFPPEEALYISCPSVGVAADLRYMSGLAVGREGRRPRAGAPPLRGEPCTRAAHTLGLRRINSVMAGLAVGREGRHPRAGVPPLAGQPCSRAAHTKMLR